jgi:four helix bundle protein
MQNYKPKYDLEERTAKFGELIIVFCKKLPKTIITIPLIGQLIKSSTSIGANYCEADCAESKKDFEHKIGICKKESNESKHWLRMIAAAIPEFNNEALMLMQEATELSLIFIAIIKKSRANGTK